MEIQQFTRKSFPVDAVHVTEADLEEIAKWCDGTVRTEAADAPDNAGKRYIKVRVENPLNERQTKAFAGDWVLYAGKGYKVYKDKPFKKSFDAALVKRNIQSNVQANEITNSNGLEKNVFEGGGVQPQTGAASHSSAAGTKNPGGGHTLG